MSHTVEVWTGRGYEHSDGAARQAHLRLKSVCYRAEETKVMILSRGQPHAFDCHRFFRWPTYSQWSKLTKLTNSSQKCPAMGLMEVVSASLLPMGAGLPPASLRIHQMCLELFLPTPPALRLLTQRILFFFSCLEACHYFCAQTVQTAQP